MHAFFNMGEKLSYPLKDKVAIVTGGNTGIGYETTKALAIMVAHMIINGERTTGTVVTYLST